MCRTEDGKILEGKLSLLNYLIGSIIWMEYLLHLNPGDIDCIQTCFAMPHLKHH